MNATADPGPRAPSLSDDEKTILLRHLNAKWAAKTCAHCNSNHWEIGGWTPVPIGTGPGEVVIGGAVLPGVAMVCMNCGVTVIVNAMVAGLDRRAG